MKVLSIGDTHCDSQSICNIAIPQAVRNDCKVIIQVGDFGYLEHVQAYGGKFLDTVSKHLVKHDVEMYWLDGNHENHPLLWEKYPPTEWEPPADGAKFCEIRPNLWYMPRGTVFTLGHVRCLALGGAFSIDKMRRLTIELQNRGHRKMYSSYGITDQMDSSINEWAKQVEGHTHWWPTEMITDEQVELAIKNAEAQGPVDIMFTHDCPEGVSVPGLHAADKWKYPETNQNRERLRTVFDAVQPKLLVHGHYHTAYTGRLPLKEEGWGCRVEGLANDGRQGFSIVLDLGNLFPVES